MTTTQLPSPAATIAEDSPESIAPRRARIDGPHTGEPQIEANSQEPLLEVEEPCPELIAAIMGQSPEARREQIELQAAQLADHLRERLRAVDRREAQVNARAAQLEADLRASRISLREREHEFQEREAQLHQQISDLQDRGSPTSGDEAGSPHDDATHQELAQREQQLQFKENELRERRFEYDRQSVALRHAQQVWQQERDRQEAELVRDRDRLAADFRRQSAERDQQLLATEQQNVQHSQQLEHDRAELAADRQAWEERRAAQAQAIQEQATTQQSQQGDRRQRLDARAQWVDEQKAGLEQVRAEVLALHRQSLESRLLAEQLWSQINSRIPAAEVTHAIAQLRTKLAEHYRLEEQSLAKRKDELLEIGQRAAEAHRELVQLREGLKAWIASRQTEIESQAASLVQRELALDEQQAHDRDERREWQAQRRAYERQIGELSGQLREPVAA